MAAIRSMMKREEWENPTTNLALFCHEKSLHYAIVNVYVQIGQLPAYMALQKEQKRSTKGV
jgi:hypothetical protein